MFGIYYDNKFYKNVNYVILLAKWYIPRQLYFTRNIDFFNFLILLKSHLDTEKYIWTCNGRLHTFNIQWFSQQNIFKKALQNKTKTLFLYFALIDLLIKMKPHDTVGSFEMSTWYMNQRAPLLFTPIALIMAAKV